MKHERRRDGAGFFFSRPVVLGCARQESWDVAGWHEIDTFMPFDMCVSPCWPCEISAVFLPCRDCHTVLCQPFLCLQSWLTTAALRRTASVYGYIWNYCDAVSLVIVIIYYYYSWDGARLCLRGTGSLTGPLSMPQMIRGWIWCSGGMTLTGENLVNLRKTCRSDTLSTTNYM